MLRADCKQTTGRRATQARCDCASAS